jgi:hypothetical protein
VLFDGAAGPYAVRVIVRPPEVVPGLAEVIVRVGATDVERVVIRPVFWRAGVAGAPAGDDLRKIAGQDRVYSGQLWLMAYGAYSVYVTVSGPRGSGTAIVPVNSFATGRLPLSPALGAILVVLGVLLAAGIVTIVRAASGESLVPPGEVFDATRRRRANRTTLIFAPILALVIFRGAKWWSSEDAGYRRFMYGSPAVDVTTSDSAGHRALRLVLHDTAKFHAIFAPVAPDHGKMMHLFLVSVPGMEHFAHLHPTQTDSLVFVSDVPALPAGRYRLFGDITLENGLSLTVTNEVHLPPAVRQRRLVDHRGDSDASNGRRHPITRRRLLARMEWERRAADVRAHGRSRFYRARREGRRRFAPAISRHGRARRRDAR